MFDSKVVNELTPERRNIAQVFQFPVVYDTMTVFDNLAFPLRNQGMAEARIHTKVQEIAEVLDLQNLLDKKARNLTADEKQKVSMGRGLVRDDVSAILFDEPLVNLDYKLREELRQEMRELFQARHTIAVYATTEPNEALALGGTTTILHEGRVIQSGKSSSVYHQPQTVLAAELFSEPPINLMPGRIAGNEVSFANFVHFPLNVDLRPVGEGEFRFGVRPSHISLVPSNDDDLELAVTVEVAEISGSETFLHVRNEHFLLVLHLPGVHEYDVDAPIRIYIPTHKLFVFDAQGKLVQAPGQRIARVA